MARFVLVAVLFLAALSAVMTMKQKTVRPPPPPTTTHRPTTHLSNENRPREEYRLHVRDTCGKVNLHLRCHRPANNLPLNSVFKEVVSTSVRTNGHNKLKIRLDRVSRPNTKRPIPGARQIIVG